MWAGMRSGYSIDVSEREEKFYLKRIKIAMKRDDVPCVPLSFNELSAIDSVLHGYLAFLRGVVPPSEERNEQLRAFYGLRGRLAVILSSRCGESVMPVTFDEAKAIQEAMVGFVEITRQVVPTDKQTG